MNFYEHQERARKQTGRLLLLFVTALILLVMLTAFVIAAIAYMLGLYSSPANNYGVGQSLWDVVGSVLSWQYLGSIALAVMAVVSLSALFRMVQLSSGGKVIAEQLGGYLVNTNPRNALERRLLNVVEEMAIAAGTPVPSVYLIDEAGINAFAAGHQPADAVIGVTRGAIEQLNRQELQGVIAHEFSHILNGDMRLNLRLIGMIYGIIVIALAGRYLLRGSHHTINRSGKGRGAVLGFGLILVALGYLGIFFGSVIKAAISRQREFLADASAVQFTRSKEGISGALKKIGGQSSQGLWQQHDAEEISHMLFSQGLQFNFLNRFMATHPPLDKRIQRIDPNWNGEFISESLHQRSGGEDGQATGSDYVGGNKNGNSLSSSLNNALNRSLSSSESLISSLASPIALTEAAVAVSASRLIRLKSNYSDLYQQIHQPYTARALVFALLIDQGSSVKKNSIQQTLSQNGTAQERNQESIQQCQWRDIQKNQKLSLFKQTEIIFYQLQTLEPHQSILLLNLALPILKLLTDQQYQDFKQQMLCLIKMDKKIELREWALFNLVNYFCRPLKTNSLNLFSLRQRKPAIAKLLTALVRLNMDSEKEAKALFTKVTENDLSFSLRWYAESELTIQSLSQSLQQLRTIKPLEKPRFLKACIHVVEHDGLIEANELEVVSCIAQAMDCPLPTSLLSL